MRLSIFRAFIMSLGVFVLFQAGGLKGVNAATVEVQMLNKDPAGISKGNVFYPPVVKIKVGDTVKFIAKDPGHNTQSIKGMIPEGAEKWQSKFNKDFEMKFTRAGVYGYKCLPHYSSGMVGLIVVEGEGWPGNFEAAKKLKQKSKAKKVFRKFFADLEADMK